MKQSIETNSAIVNKRRKIPKSFESGASCSKLTTSLVNISLKFKM